MNLIVKMITRQAMEKQMLLQSTKQVDWSALRLLNEPGHIWMDTSQTLVPMSPEMVYRNNIQCTVRTISFDSEGNARYDNSYNDNYNNNDSSYSGNYNLRDDNF
jgi:hypothetical protein